MIFQKFQWELLAMIELFAACAPNVAPYTLQEIVRVESSFNPIAVNVNVRKVNGKRVRFNSPIKNIKTKEQAIYVSKAAIRAGHSVDMGYMQINSTNLKALGYTVDEMFNDPCKNIKAGAKVLTAFYSRAVKQYPNEQAALRAALSAYNTGNFKNGFTNGYVARFIKNGNSANIPDYRQNQVAAARVNTANNQITNMPSTSLPNSIFYDPRTQGNNTMSNKVTIKPVVSESQKDAGVAGVQVQYTADEAMRNGAFVETAMSEADAWESNGEIAQEQPHSTAIFMAGAEVR